MVKPTPPTKAEKPIQMSNRTWFVAIVVVAIVIVAGANWLFSDMNRRTQAEAECAERGGIYLTESPLHGCYKIERIQLAGEADATD